MARKLILSVVFGLAAGARCVLACEDPAQVEAPMVTLGMPEGPMYVGSYARVPVRIAPGLVLDIDDLAFRVMEGPQGGIVSMSRDATFNSKKPDIMLIAGWKPGTYRLDVLAKTSGHLITSAPFRVSVLHSGEHGGPGTVNQGASRLRQLGSAWGGGPAGLQNVGIKPAGAQLRIALIFVDTIGQEFDLAEFPTPIQDDWEDNIVNGVTNPNDLDDPDLYSVAKFYEQASGGSMDVLLEAVGPYHLPGSWATVGPVEADTPSSANPEVTFTEHVQAAITAADKDLVYMSGGHLNYDCILVVSHSVGAPGDPSEKFAWPISTIGAWEWDTWQGKVDLAATQMPYDWHERDYTSSTPRTIYETVCHELGHSLGMLDQYQLDQYPPELADCFVGGFDLMAGEYNLPNFSIAHRLALGWLDETWVKGFNFASSVVPVDETVKLSPISAEAPAADTYAGIEFRIADGWNDYSELRWHLVNPISDPILDKIADKQLNPAPCILNTDVAFNSVTALSPSRPDILLVRDYLPPPPPPSPPPPYTGQQLVGVNDAYAVSDTTTPGYPADFRIKLLSFSDSPPQASVQVTYGANLVPDPSITPWGGPPWQTSDIEVRNARNEVDDEWFNVPWEGHPNTVIAKVKNGETLDAPGVQVSFFVKDYNVGGSPETLLGTDTQDVARGDTVEFSADWLPPAAGHKCIIARIAPYTRPAVPPSSPAVPEVTTTNNEAQSNYNHFISATASPAERQVTQIAVGNPYDQATRVYLSLKQTNPLYRTYLEHTWLDLGPGETRSVTAMFEYVGELPAPLRASTSMESFVREQNEVAIQSFIVNPADPTGHNILPLGGAGASVATGLATKFATFEMQGGAAQGQVTTSAGAPVTGGFVILTFTAGKGATARLTTQTVPVHDRGMFDALPLPMPTGVVEAYFVAPEGFGDATASLTIEETPEAK